MNGTTKREELMSTLKRKVEEVDTDPEVAKREEKVRRKLQRNGKPTLDDFIGEKLKWGE